MKKVLSLALSLSLPTLSAPALVLQDAAPQQPQQQQAQAPAALGNKDVLDMIQAGLSAEVVVAKIRSSAANFDTSPSALQELKTSGVPDSVILAVVQAPAGAAAPPAPEAAAPAEPVNVPDGTEVEVELVNTASGQELKVGDVVDFKIIHPVQLNGVTIFEKGAPARARITTAKKAGHWGRAGKLEWAMQDLQSADGNRIPARFTQRAVGDSKGGTVAVGAVATTVLFPPAALLWGLKKGKPAIIPAGNRYRVFVHGDTTVRGKTPAPAAAADAN